MEKEIRLGKKTVRYVLQRKQVKNINIRVKSDLSVHVSASPRVSVERIEALLRERGDFILSALAKFEKAREESARAERDGTVAVFGKDLPIVTEQGSRNLAKIEPDRILLTLKDTADGATLQKTLQAALDALCKSTVERLCREIYPSFSAYCPKFPEIKFRRMKSRWGSCHFQKHVLTFNYHLIHAPVDCVEYVVYHEFTHFIHHDHSKAFYLSLSRSVPDYKEQRNRLKNVKIYRTEK